MVHGKVRVSHGGESIEIEASRWEDAADQLVARHGPGVPSVERISTPAEAQNAATAFAMTAAQVASSINADPTTNATARVVGSTTIEVKPRATGIVMPSNGPVIASPRKPSKGLTLGSPLDVPAGKFDLLGHARSSVDVDAAIAEGFAVAPPLFDRGTRVTEAGAATVGSSRLAWEDLPTVIDNCQAHSDRIQAEEREDAVALATMVRLQEDGRVSCLHVDDPHGAPLSHYRVTPEAFGSLVTRLQIPAAGRYLRSCWPELRATNVNGWIDRLAVTEQTASDTARAAGRASAYTPIDLRIRHRIPSRAAVENGREAFAIVGPEYGEFDADKIDQAIAMSVPREARGRVTYDGCRSRWEVIFHTTVQSRHAVAGEFMRAGVVVTTDDGGGGAIHGQAFAHQALCLNIIHVQTTTTAHFAIRHIGDVEAIAKKFSDGFRKAMGAIDHFVRAWDLAVEDEPIEARRRLALPSGDELVAGIFRDAIVRKVVPIPTGAGGQMLENAVTGLVRAWRGDKSGAAGMTRAAIINAFTRWVHTDAQGDPWFEDEIQSAAGKLLQRTKRDDAWATPLGFLAPEDVKGR